MPKLHEVARCADISVSTVSSSVAASSWATIADALSLRKDCGLPGAVAEPAS